MLILSWLWGFRMRNTEIDRVQSSKSLFSTVQNIDNIVRHSYPCFRAKPYCKTHRTTSIMYVRSWVYIVPSKIHIHAYIFIFSIRKSPLISYR